MAGLKFVAGFVFLLTAGLVAAQTFEVASVREHEGTNFRSGPLTISDSLIRLEGYTIYGLVMDAWNVRDFQLKVSPDIPKDDVYNNMYDISTRAPGEGRPKVDDVRAMLRNLLGERFRLRTHREMQEMEVYLLQVAKGGPQLKANSTGALCDLHTGLARDGRNDEETFSSCSIERLADRLGNKIGGRPVLDRTGLTGLFDMRLIAVPEFRTRSGADPADIDPRTAVRELGLTLTPGKAQVDVIVVDHLERLNAN